MTQAPAPPPRAAKTPLPKACIFCGAKGKLTREEIFPEWFRPLYPRPQDSEKLRLNAQVSWYEFAEDGTIHRQTSSTHLARNGDLADQTLRVVCATCNNRWMSRLQERAKPVLLPYITGHWRYPDAIARKIIAAWATMFTMVTEFGDEQAAAIPAPERLVFSRDQIPLVDSCVWAGRLTGDLPYWFHHRALRLTDHPFQPVGRPNAQLTTITLGHLLLQVYTTTAELSMFDARQRAIELGLELVWPPRPRPLKRAPLRIRDAAEVRDFAYEYLPGPALPGIIPEPSESSSS